MVGGHAQVMIGQFTSHSAEATVNVQLGFIPDAVILWQDIAGTEIPYVWFRKGLLSNIAASDDGFRFDTGDITAALIDVYAGGDVVAAGDVTTRSYVDPQGTVSAAGVVTREGFKVKVAGQVNSGKNVYIAFRNGY